MSERTGATAVDEYGRPYDPCDSSRAKTIIAAHRAYRAWALPDGTGMTWYDLDDFRQVGEWVIPPGMVIVPSTAVPDQAVIAAIESVLCSQFITDHARETLRAWLAAQEGE